MNRTDIERLKEGVGCAAVLESHAFLMDKKESTQRAVKFRRGGEIIIVTHEGRGWFDPLSEAKGDVFTLVSHLDDVGFSDAAERVAALIGYQTTEPAWERQAADRPVESNFPERWATRRRPAPHSPTWAFLKTRRFLPSATIRAAVAQNCLREGPYGSMWALHSDAAGSVTGWEERGPEWRGFSTGGSKILFRFGAAAPKRSCVTEAAIDAMSLAAIEQGLASTLYVSTGGGWSRKTEAAIADLAAKPDIVLVAATDANDQGDAFADRIAELAQATGCLWARLRPSANDWNDMLRLRAKSSAKQRRR